MKDFIISLYANENFPIYLGAIIIVLLIAFFVVFFLGRKDKKKIEMTQRLEKINADAFKDISTPVDVNIAVPETPNTLEQSTNTQVEANPIVEQPVPEVTEIEISESEIVPENMETSNTNVMPPVEETPVENNIPDLDTYKSPQSFDKVVEEKPTPKFNPELVVEPYIPATDLSNFNELASSIEVELNALEKQQEVAKPIINNEPVTTMPIIEMPVVPEVSPVIETPVTPVIEPVRNTEVVEPPVQPVLEPIQPESLNITPSTEVKPTKVMTDVFSSVYAPKKENPPILEDTMAIELPRLKDAKDNEEK